MLEQTQEIFDSMERMKETQRLQYDYFKHLTTLSVTSIGVIVAVIKLDAISKFHILAGFSIFGFLVCLVAALWAMPISTNSILYLTGIRIITTSTIKSPEERKADFEEFSANYTKTLGRIGFSDHLTRWTFLAGVLIFLAFAGLNFIS